MDVVLTVEHPIAKEKIMDEYSFLCVIDVALVVQSLWYGFVIAGKPQNTMGSDIGTPNARLTFLSIATTCATENRINLLINGHQSGS